MTIKQLTLSDVISAMTLACLITSLVLFAVATKPDEVVQQLRTMEATIMARANTNAHSIEQLHDSHVEVIEELSELRRSLSDLYQALVRLIEARTGAPYLPPAAPEAIAPGAAIESESSNHTAPPVAPIEASDVVDAVDSEIKAAAKRVNILTLSGGGGREP